MRQGEQLARRPAGKSTCLPGPEGSSAPRAERGDHRPGGEWLLRGPVRSWPGVWISSLWQWGATVRASQKGKTWRVVSEGGAIGRQDRSEGRQDRRHAGYEGWGGLTSYILSLGVQLEPSRRMPGSRAQETGGGHADLGGRGTRFPFSLLGFGFSCSLILRPDVEALVSPFGKQKNTIGRHVKPTR